LSDEISIQFTRFSAFYSPLIATFAGGFLQAEGLRPVFQYSRLITKRHRYEDVCAAPPEAD
jgi:hypothetical protein